MTTNAPNMFNCNVKKYLITCDNWFVAPDGKEYKAAWGEVKIIDDSFLGIKTNKGSSNWFAQVGSDKKHIIIAGCQIHYAVICDKKPCVSRVDSWSNIEKGGISEYKRPTKIYIAE